MSNYVVDVLTEFLGEERSHNEHKGQISFDCPSCAIDKNMYGSTDGKGNLEINYKHGYFKCWACHQKNNMKGVLGKLFHMHANKELLKRFNLVKPDYKYGDGEEEEVKKVVTTKLPEGYMKLTEDYVHQTGYREAMAYLAKRGIGQEIINKFNIGFINSGRFKNRIIIPSYDTDGNINYFVGRGFNKWVKPKYMNSEAPKEDIIFNHSLINPYATIYLVEGPFDSLVVPNCIPLLGLYLHDNLYWYLQKNARADVVVILDGEAKKDGETVYKKLNSLYLYNRVKIIYLKEEYDTSLIYERFGNKGIKAILKSATQLNERYY